MHRRYWTLFGVTIITIGILWFTSPTFLALEPIPITITHAEKKDIYDSVIARGNIEEGDSQEIYLSSSAKIDQVCVSVGDSVENGQVLFEVSPAENPLAAGGNLSALLPELGDIHPEEIISVFSEYGIDAQDILSQQVPAVSSEPQEPEVRSPIAGIVTSINAKKDALLSNYQAIATVSDFSKLLVRVQIPEMYISRIQVGQSVDITGEAMEGRTYLGTVEKIYPVAKQKASLTGSGETVVDTMIRIINPDELLKPGYSVSAKIYTQKKSGALTIPYDCVWQDDQNRELVFVEQDGQVYKKRIQTGLELEKEIEVVRGLEKDDAVVLSPPKELKNGTKVKAGVGS